MKRQDIDAGTVYALRSAGDRHAPVMFLHDGGSPLYAQDGRRKEVRELTEEERRRVTRPESRFNGSKLFGYLVIACPDGLEVTNEMRKEAAAAMGKADAADELERFLDGEERPSVAGTRFTVVTSLAQISETWEAYQERWAAKDKADRLEADRQALLRTRASAVRREFERSCAAYATWDDRMGELRVPLADAERIAELLRNSRG